MRKKIFTPLGILFLMAGLSFPMVGCEREAEVETPYGETEIEAEEGLDGQIDEVEVETEREDGYQQ